MKSFTNESVVALLKKKQANSTQAEFAAVIGISAQYLGDIYGGRRAPGPAVLEFLGLQKAYIPADTKETVKSSQEA
jgi:transcriptional regulator with XRE-family HTH domain